VRRPVVVGAVVAMDTVGSENLLLGSEPHLAAPGSHVGFAPPLRLVIF